MDGIINEIEKKISSDGISSFILSLFGFLLSSVLTINGFTRRPLSNVITGSIGLIIFFIGLIGLIIRAIRLKYYRQKKYRRPEIALGIIAGAILMVPFVVALFLML